METPTSPISQPISPTPKKGLGTGAKIGIGCASVIGLIIIGFVVVGLMFGGKMKKFAEEAQKNPTRATATMMVTTGAMEMVAEDDVNKRYTVKDKKSGTLTTIYWNEKTRAAEVVQGDFTAIPTNPPTTVPATGSEPAPDTDNK